MEQGQPDQAGKHQQNGKHQLQHRTEDVRRPGLVLALRAERPLHDRLVADPVCRAEDEPQTQENGGPWKLEMIGREHQVEVMLGPALLADFLL